MNKSFPTEYLAKKNFTPFPFQKNVWEAYWSGKSGILRSPTGSGKTYALFLPHASEKQDAAKSTNDLELLWITPLRALAKDLETAMADVIEEASLPISLGRRTGDTSNYLKQKYKTKAPNVLITTPESMHVMLAQKNASQLFKNVKAIVVDEWHELYGTKRGVQVELAVSRIKHIAKDVKIWGVSATIGDVEVAKETLLGNNSEGTVIDSQQKKALDLRVVLPDSPDRFPWAGHLGITMLQKIIPLIEQGNSALIFTNTRSQAEIWFQRLLEMAPDLVGLFALHHGSIDREKRAWIEDAIKHGKLKAVICTSSLDLGVDFPAVDTVFHIGSPKGISRFVQRAGRSNHNPGKESVVYFVPTNSPELLDYLALRKAVVSGRYENKVLIQKPSDVLLQYLMTLAVGDGFTDNLFNEVKATYTYRNLLKKEWQEMISFLKKGGPTLKSYERYRKIKKTKGVYVVTTPQIARFHKSSIGTITEEPGIQVKFLKGRRIGTIEERFISKLQKGDVFTFGGKMLEYKFSDHTTVYVKLAKAKKGVVPRWLGSNLSFSTLLSAEIKDVLTNFDKLPNDNVKHALSPLLSLQREWSVVPGKKLVFEQIKARYGYHLFCYPLEGKATHEGMAALIAQRLSQEKPQTFSIAVNDYGFELLSDEPIEVNQTSLKKLLDPKELEKDILQSANATEMTKRKFRDIAQISGLIQKNIKGASRPVRHLQSSSSLLFDVLTQYEKNNMLLAQSFQEVLNYQLEKNRLREVLERSKGLPLKITAPPHITPFAFPLFVERIRDKVSSEDLQTRIQKLQKQLNTYAK